MPSDSVLMALRVLTALSSFVVTLSPSPAILKIYKTQSVGPISIFPLISLLANSHMWMLYGYFRGNIFPVMVSFGFGDIAALVYLAVYYKFADDRKYVRIAVACGLFPLLVVSVYAIIASKGITGQTFESISHIMGYLGIVAAILLYGAPFERVMRVLRTKNASSVQIVMVICGATNNFLWVVYTSIDKSWFMFIPNVICLPLGIVMLVLYVLYHPKRAVQPSVNLPNGDIAISIELSPKAEARTKSQALSPSYALMSSPLAPIRSMSSVSNGSSVYQSPMLRFTVVQVAELDPLKL
jgi:solute carrier family 50 protein (sugar transporter)